MSPISSLPSFSLASSKRAMNVSYEDSSPYLLSCWLQLNAEGIEEEIPREIARRKYESMQSRLGEIREVFSSIDKSELILRESNLPLSLFTYLYLYLQSTVSARVAEDPESDLLEVWNRAETALFYMSQEESEESAAVVKKCIAALFPEEGSIFHFLHKLVEIALLDSNYMSCSLGFLIGAFQEEGETDKKVELSTALGSRAISFRETKPVLMDVQIFVQALYDSYKKIPERIEVFRRWLLNHIEKLERFPEAVTRRILPSWKEGISSLEQEMAPLIAASLEEFPKLLLGEFVFQEEAYTMEKIVKKLSRYYEDVEGVLEKIHNRSFQNESILKIASSGYDFNKSSSVYSQNIPNAIDSLEQMSAVLDRGIVPHPAYFSYTGVHLKLLKTLKELLRESVSKRYLVEHLVEHYELTSNTFETFCISSSESEITNPYPHVYEYRLSAEDLEASIAFEEEARKVREAFETYVSLTLAEAMRFISELNNQRDLLKKSIFAVDSRIVPTHQQRRQALSQKTVKKNALEFDQFLRDFKPYAWLESSEEVKIRLFAEALLREEEYKVSAKKGKKSSREKKKSSSVSRKKSVKELSPLEALQKQMDRLKNLLSSAACAQEDAFMKAALFQSQLSLFHLEQVACYTSIFSAKVWLPIFLEEGYLTVEQAIKGIFPQIEDRTSHGIKHLLEQSLQAPFVSYDALDNIDKGYVTSYRFLDVYKEAKKAQQWFGSYKTNPLISKGMESLDEVQPTEMLIQEACQIAKILESFFPSREIAKRQEQKLSKRFSATLPFVSLMPERQLYIKPFVQRKMEVEAHLKKAFVFNRALLEILQHLNSEETFTEEQMALHCKEIAFLATKSIEFALHAILSGQDNVQLRYSHDICELFEEAFGHQEQTLQEMRAVLTNAHLCLRYPLQKRKIYSTVHKISLVAAKVLCPQAEAVESIFLQLQQDEMQEPFDFLQEQATHVLLFTKTLFEEYLIGALERMA